MRKSTRGWLFDSSCIVLLGLLVGCTGSNSNEPDFQPTPLRACGSSSTICWPPQKFKSPHPIEHNRGGQLGCLFVEYEYGDSLLFRVRSGDDIASVTLRLEFYPDYHVPWPDNAPFYTFEGPSGTGVAIPLDTIQSLLSKEKEERGADSLPDFNVRVSLLHEGKWLSRLEKRFSIRTGEFRRMVPDSSKCFSIPTRRFGTLTKTPHMDGSDLSHSLVFVQGSPFYDSIPISSRSVLLEEFLDGSHQILLVPIPRTLSKEKRLPVYSLKRLNTDLNETDSLEIDTVLGYLWFQ